MTITVQQGKTATIKLRFTNPDGSVASAPSSGGSVHVNSVLGNTIGTATLNVDQETVTYFARALGTDTITYAGPAGLAATETTNNVATTANAVSFDETSLTVA